MHRNAIPDDERGEQNRGDEKIDERGKGRRNRDNDSGKVDSCNQLLIRYQTVCRVRNSTREELPRKQRSEREQRIRNSFGRDSGKAAEEDAEYDHHREWLKNRPDDSQSRLLVANLNVAPRQKVNEFTVRPQLAWIKQPPAGSRLDFKYR